MSYNKAHHSNGFQASADPGILIPEDLRLLALNHRVFPKFTYRVPQDVPSGYQICPNIAKLGPMDMPDGFPYRFDISTPSGNAAGSTVKNLATGVIKPDKGPGITFDKRTMWQSDPSTDGWVFVNLKFPDTVTLTSLTVHSEHSGKHHRAVCLILEVMDGGKFREVCAIPLPNSDALVQVPKTSGQVWRLRFQAGPSHVVALRGLQFFSDDTEVFGVPAFTPAPNTLTPN
jgi:hypothetical protein